MDQQAIEAKKEEQRSRTQRLREQQLAAQELMLQPYRQALAAKGDLASKAQFFHKKEWKAAGGRTFAVVAPDGDALRTAAIKLLSGGQEVGVEVVIGISHVNTHAGDTYNKKVGRIVATSKLQPVIMKLRAANVYENVQHFSLILGKLNLEFSIEKNPSLPRFVQAWES
jgi:hypothetical protein